MELLEKVKKNRHLSEQKKELKNIRQILFYIDANSISDADLARFEVENFVNDGMLTVENVRQRRDEILLGDLFKKE